MPDITMSLDDTLEIDTIIEESTRASEPITEIKYEGNQTNDYNSRGIQTHTEVFEPKKSGNYTITVNGQDISIDVKSPRSIPSTVVESFEDGSNDEYQTVNGGWSTSTNYVWEGTYSGRFDQNASHKAFSSEGDGLNYYPKQGDVVEWYVYHDYVETSTTGIVIGNDGKPSNWSQGYDCNYRADGNNSNFSMNLGSREGGNSTKPVGNYLDEWLRGRFEFSSGGVLLYELYQTNNSKNREDHTLIDSVTYDASGENALSNSGFGFFANNFGNGGRRSLAYYDSIKSSQDVV